MLQQPPHGCPPILLLLPEAAVEAGRPALGCVSPFSNGSRVVRAIIQIQVAVQPIPKPFANTSLIDTRCAGGRGRAVMGPHIFCFSLVSSPPSHKALRFSFRGASAALARLAAGPALSPRAMGAGVRTPAARACRVPSGEPAGAGPRGRPPCTAHERVPRREREKTSVVAPLTSEVGRESGPDATRPLARRPPAPSRRLGRRPSRRFLGDLEI
jgi:hypothetical protein